MGLYFFNSKRSGVFLRFLVVMYLDVPGRPLLYGTTENFLRCFNISDLEQLPPLPEEEKEEEEGENDIE